MPVIESAKAKLENAAITAAATTTRRREEGKKVTLKFTSNQSRPTTSGPASPSEITTRLQRIHLRDHPRRLIFQPRPLFRIVLLRILARKKLEVQIPQVFVDDILPLAQIVDPCLICLHKGISPRPEDEHEQ